MAKNKKNSNFSKGVVLFVIIANILFTVAVLSAFIMTQTEPSTLIMSWFGFTTAELWSLASIKKTKEKNKGDDENG
jgi:hypothetical protein